MGRRAVPSSGWSLFIAKRRTASSWFIFKVVPFRSRYREEGVLMNELLNLAVKAHGGLERWNKVKSVRVAASITGAIWFVKGKGDALKNIVMTIETKKERLTTDF